MNTFKTVTAALLLAATVSATAADTNNLKLKSDMRSMLSAMEVIQSGGFYNNKESMLEGVKRLKKGLVSLRSSDAKLYLPKDQAYADKFANKRADMIAMYADDITASMNDGNWEDSLNDYQQILNQCTSCHIRMRSW